MRRRESRPTSKHTMYLYQGQIDRLQELFPRLGAAKAIRTIIDDYLRRIDEEAARAVGPVPETQIELKELL